MKKTIKFSLLMVICVLSIVILSSCNISQSYADKINAAAEADENMTYDEIEKKLGKPTVSLIFAGNGSCTWIDGIDEEEFAAMTEDFIKTANENAYKKAEGKKSITVTFASGKATSATFQKYEKADK